MALQSQSIREQRRDQIYPAFDATEIERVRKFGKVRSFAGGERLWTAGRVSPGLTVVLAGSIAVTQRDQFDNEETIGILRPGNFLGELAQLSGRPALVDAIAQDPVRVLIIPPDQAEGGSKAIGSAAILVQTSHKASGSGSCAYWIGRPYRASPAKTVAGLPTTKFRGIDS